MATIPISQLQIKTIAFITQDGEFKEHNTITEKNKNVRFAEDTQIYYYDKQKRPTKKALIKECPTKTHDGMEYAKQVTEYLVYAFFERGIITCDRIISPILNEEFGVLEETITKRVVKLLMNAYKRVTNLLTCPETNNRAALFKNTMGKYSLVFTKEHKIFLRRLIKWTKQSFQQSASARISPSSSASSSSSTN
jgi:hypothetical protein